MKLIQVLLLLCLFGLAVVNAQTVSGSASGTATPQTTLSDSASGTATPQTTLSGSASGTATPQTTISDSPSGTATPQTTLSGSASGTATPQTTLSGSASGTASPPAGTVSGSASGTASPAAGTVSGSASGTASPAAGTVSGTASGTASPAASSAGATSAAATPSAGGSSVPPAGSSVPPAGSSVPPAGSSVPPAGSSVPPAGSSAPAPAGTVNSGSNPPVPPSAIQPVPVTLITDNANLQSAVAGLPTGQYAEFVQSDGSHNFIANNPTGFNQVALKAPPASCGNGIVEAGEVCDDGSAPGSPDSCCASCKFAKNDNQLCGKPTTSCTKSLCISGACKVFNAPKVQLSKVLSKNGKATKIYLNGTRCDSLAAQGVPNSPGFPIYTKGVKNQSKKGSQPKGVTKFDFCDGNGKCDPNCSLLSNVVPTLGC